MANNLVDGQALLADGPIFPGTWAYYDGIEHISYDPNAAVEALKKAGYNFPAGGGSVRMKENVALAFELLHPQDDLHTKLAEAIQSDWTQMGISVTLKSVPYDELVNNYLNGRLYQAALVDLNLARSPTLILIPSGIRRRSPVVKTIQSGITARPANTWKRGVSR